MTYLDEPAAANLLRARDAGVTGQRPGLLTTLELQGRESSLRNVLEPSFARFDSIGPHTNRSPQESPGSGPGLLTSQPAP